jgi:hypothetical protein
MGCKTRAGHDMSIMNSINIVLIIVTLLRASGAVVGTKNASLRPVWGTSLPLPANLARGSFLDPWAFQKFGASPASSWPGRIFSGFAKRRSEKLIL